MDYVNPSDVVESMVEAGAKKAKLPVHQLLVRGFLGAALLGFATTLAFTFELQTKIGMLGAIIFPVGFVMIILLGLELVTGSFALIPLAVMEKKATVSEMLRNFFWVIIGHIIGGIIYGLMIYVSITNFGQTFENPLTQKIISVADVKTNGYATMGADGLLIVFIKAMLCNWMVTLGAVLAMVSKSTAGKIIAMWLPITTFFGQGFEHAVVNMFVIPTGILLGADVTIIDWWLWNQIPVTIGNLVSGFLFTGLALYFIHKISAKKKEQPQEVHERLKKVSF